MNSHDIDEETKEEELSSRSQFPASRQRLSLFFPESLSEKITVDHSRPRRLSNELLESVKLRPVYVSFPRNGHSPPGAYLNTPRLKYKSIDNSPPIYPTSPDSVTEYFGAIKKLSTFGAVITGVNYLLGIGILGLPFSLEVTGWFGLVSILFIGCLMAYSGCLLGDCQFRLSVATYPDIVEAAFGYCGRDIVSVIFYFHLLFDMALFLTLLTESMRSLLKILQFTTDSAIMTILTTIIIICSNMSNNMNYICFCSVVGTASTLLVCGMVIFVCVRRILLSDTKLLSYGSIQISYNALYQTPSVLLREIQCFGLHSFCFMGHGVLPSVFKSMRHPSSYRTVTICVFGTMVVFYLFIASVGYLAFKGHIRGNIIENFDQDDPLTTIVIILTIVTVITKFILAAFPVSEGIVDMVMPMLKSKTENFMFTDSYPSPESEDILNEKSLRVRANSLSRMQPHRAEYNIGFEESSSNNDMSHINNDDSLATQIVSSAMIVIIRILVPVAALILAFVLPDFIELLSVIGIIFGSIISYIIPFLSYVRIYREEISLSQRWILHGLAYLSAIIAVIAVTTNKF